MADTNHSTASVVRDALGVSVVGFSGFAFGVTAAAAGFSTAQTCALSLLMFTGASQYAFVAAVAAGATPLAAVSGALVLGLRNAFYGIRLGPHLRVPRPLRPLAAQLVIDETAAVALAQRDVRSARLGFLTTGIALFVLWNATTVLGAFGGSAVADPARWGLDALGPAVFLALLVGMVRGLRAPERAAGTAETTKTAEGTEGAEAVGAAGATGARDAGKDAGAGPEGGPTPGTARLTALLAAVASLVAVPLLPLGLPVLVGAAAIPLALFVERRRRRGAPRPTTADPTTPDTTPDPTTPDPSRIAAAADDPESVRSHGR
ncbi:AzlC family ABC transporter permease [Allostreptomyces psammosilenae]|uniref:Putative branched-subunit amino acid permease n=1 Tax=Allostreptomyces psammosilenae TaxID=1892865 RepID=A0A852ZWN8_9ACTN|nr:putative branched-subunit amino acid permease [Allostreptomyces psammosilenae]